MDIKRVVILIMILLISVGSGQAQDKQPNRELTLADIYEPQRQVNFYGTVPRISWLNDGHHYLQWNYSPAKGDVGVFKVDINSGNREPFINVERMQKALRALPDFGADSANQIATFGVYTLSPQENAALLTHDNDLYFYDFGSGQAKRLTNGQEAETDESFSPDGRKIAFVRSNNIFVLDLASGKETALTKDGSKDIFNGRLDWVYEEEIYGRGVTRSYWWSPDSAEVAFLRLDDGNVPEFHVIDDVPGTQGVERTKYPRAGEPNPKVQLGAVNVAGGNIRWVDLNSYQPLEILVTRVGWSPDSKHIVFQVQNREQNWLDLNLADKSGQMRNLLRETSPAWVEVVELPIWLPDNSFIWQSDRSGWRHLYHYAIDGKLIKPVTKGDWDVRELFGQADNWIYFSGTEHSHLSTDIYRVKLDGSSLTRISDDGNHSANFNKQFTAYVDQMSTVTRPPQTRLVKNDGALTRTIEENKIAALSEFKLSKPEFVRVPTSDGVMLDALMIKPVNFDANKKYPVLSYAYAGPGAPSVKNAWLGSLYMFHQYLAQQGYIIWICDNRSASQKGMQSAYPVYRNLGELELRDIEDGMAWLKKQPYVDGDRLGLWGWSYGGFITAYALTHSKTFKVGISGAPVTDWRNYDSVYTERYMKTPKNNPEGYFRSSVVEAAKQLHGKLLLIHGTMDDNVHLQNSIQFIDALQRAGKDFDMMVYPKSRHGVTQPQRVKHLREMMAKFILENL